MIAESLPEEMYETTEKERNVQKHIDEGLDGFTISLNDEGEYVFKHSMKTPNPKKESGNTIELQILIVNMIIQIQN